MNLINILDNQLIKRANIKPNFKILSLKVGDLISIRTILSKKLKRKQVFTGFCIKIRNRGFRSTITLKNVIDNVIVIKTFPFYSSMITDITVK